MLKAQIFHANALDKLPKIHEQLNNLLSQLNDDGVVSVNSTEITGSGVQNIYSYTVLVVYRTKE